MSDNGGKKCWVVKLLWDEGKEKKLAIVVQGLLFLYRHDILMKRDGFQREKVHGGSR